MARVTAIATAVLAAVSVSGCVPRQEPEPSAKILVVASADGLRDLFREECIKQRNLAWVRRESARLRSQCLPFLDDSDCLLDKDGRVSWQRSTTAGQQLTVTMFWNAEQPGRKPGPPDGQLSCSIEATEDLGDAIQTAAARIAEEDLSLGPAWKFRVGEGQLWPPIGSQAKAQLELFHASPDAVAKHGFAAWELRYLADWQVPLSREYLIDPKETSPQPAR